VISPSASIEDKRADSARGNMRYDGMRTKKRELGFTMIELVIAVAIIAIMAAIAIPGFSTWLPNYRLKSAARDLYSNMQLAKIGAVRNNANWAIVFDPGVSPGRYFICSEDGANDTWDGPAAMLGDDVVEKTVDFTLSPYRGVVDYGHGNATTNATVGGGAFPADDISYTTPDNVAIFTPRGTVNNLGYVYLSNNKGSSYAAATPNIAGVIILRKWTGTAWE